MVVESSLHPDALSNTYLVRSGGRGLFVDAGGPVAPLIESARRNGVTPTHVLLTHHHPDHVWELSRLVEQWPGMRVLIDDRERSALEKASPELAEVVTGSLEGGTEVDVSGLTVSVLHTPGHTAGMMSLLIDGNVFTGDTLFRGSVGGVRAPGATTYEDLKASIMGTLMGLAPETVIRPGHCDATTVAEEWETNPFIRIWRGLDPEGEGPCVALDEEATLVLMARDYDGGHKAWVRWADGRDDIVPGSKVTVPPSGPN
jgi:glyoxylase-like metal-dependent hydrolase (beta-lactamase superfamily II)